MCHLLKTALINKKEINDILTDMVFTNFICPAVVSPDLFGISDAPISENARFNLIQIGQILQMLALVKHEDIDSKYLELFEMFDRNLVSELMDQLLETEYDISVSMMAIPHQNDFGRRHVLVTQSELNIFVDFFRNVLDNDGLIISGDDRRKLGKVLDQLPDKWETVLNGNESQTVHASPEHMNRAKQSLINLGKSTKTKLAKTISMNVAGMNHNDHNVDDSSAVLSNGNHNGSASKNGQLDYEQVLVIPIAIHEESKFQLLTEQEVLNMNNISNEIAPSTENLDELDKIGTDFNEVESDMRNRKHTRFSLSNDDQSIGNTSDNLEVVSEAQSNHSVTSSLEMEENDQNLNDNLSDMVSANVSGRGTPNISGRDTPSSQVTEGETPPIPPLQMAKILNKARSEIEEKFCKFEIKKLVEVDETISIISDTWSTDVLASDSETIEQPDCERNFSTPLIPSSVILPGDNNFDPLRGSGSQRGGFLEGSDTRSESAWSTDVLASDSEKTTEIDTDDNQSIAANSDITDAGRSESDLARDIEVPNRAPDSPFFAPRAPSSSVFRTPDLITFSQRPSDYSNVRMFEDGTSRNGQSSARLPSDDLVRFLSPSSFQSRSRDEPNYSDGSAAFRGTPYRGFDRDGFVNARIRRQNSAESSISNHSSNCDDGSSPAAIGSLAASLKRTNGADHRRDYRFPDYPMDARNSSSTQMTTETNLINLFSDDEPGTSVDRSVINRNRSDNYSSVVVEHRRTSNDQRTASVDGRRNAMSANQVRQAASISYENHEIITQKTSTLQIVAPVNSSATDDDKTNERNEFLLIQKTMSLNLNNDVQESNGDDFMTDDVANKPNKYTGAIPKSISFDSSADKNDRSYLRRPDVRSNGTSFFNKIKQGFKNRHSKKRGGQEDFTGGTGRGNGSVGLDEANGAATNGFNGNEQISFFDTSEDILAKYRRKISSSSEATNSDSVGNPRKNSQSDIDQR